MTSLETAFEKASADGTLAGAALLAATTDKGIVYSKAFGKRSLEKDAQDMTVDDVMQLYSATKLVTSISAMQLVERSLFTLDEDVSRVLPEIGGLKVLTGMNGSEPVFEEPKSKITLRYVLSIDINIEWYIREKTNKLTH
jgi:CubicO group peptidase (beta-lactamase class C family)